MIERLAFALLGLAWLVPNHYTPWSSFYNEAVAVVGLALLALPLRSAKPVSAPVAAWFIFAASGIVLVQWAVGQIAYAGDAWVSILYLAAFATAVIVGHHRATISADGLAQGLSLTLLVGGLISAVLALTQALDLRDFGDWVENAPSFRPFANLGQPNNLATLLGLAALGLLLLYERRRVSPWTCAALLVPLVLAGALTQSRTALLFGPLVCLGLFLAKRRGLPMKTSPRIVVGLFVVQWLFAAFWPSIHDTLLLAADVQQSLAQRGLESRRFQMWPLLFDALMGSPWFGFGWLQIGAAQLSVANSHAPTGELWMHGHNLFVDLLVWCGFPLGLFLCFAVSYWFCSRWRKVQSVEATVGMLSVTIFGLHSMLELPHHYLYFLVPIGLWIGQIERWTNAPVVGGSRWSLVPQVLVVVLGLGIAKDYMAVEEDFRLVRFENLKIGPANQQQSAPNALMLSGLTSFLRFARTEPVRGLTRAQLDSMEANVRRYPYSSSLYRLGIALALNGRVEEAKERLVSVRHIFGEATYRGVRASLQSRIDLGDAPELVRLQSSLPD